jgi:hypothetical protein
VQPVGRPLPQTQVLVLADNHQLCSIGEVGEIVIRTPFRTLGYLKTPSSSGFVQNPFRADASDWLFHTGDLGRYQSDGTLEILGRRDDQVKVRGVRIEPAEVAAALHRHPGVRACAVAPYHGGDGETSLAAYVVAALREDGLVQQLRSYLAQQLPLPMVPSAFVLLDALPLTPNGKVDRQALPAPADTRSRREQAYVAPRTPGEETMAEIWGQVLKLVRVSIRDDFFDLGGNSILATQLVSRVRQQFAVEIPLRTMFEMPTIEGQALYLLEQQAHATQLGVMEELLAELESMSEEGAVSQLRATDGQALSPHIGPADETASATPDFSCPKTPSEWFGKRNCELVIVLNEHFETTGFERVAGYVREFDPSIATLVVRDQPSLDLPPQTRPALIVSPALIRHRLPLRGRIFSGYPHSKAEEYTALAKAGIPIPRWVLVEQGVVPDLSGFDDYIVRKPNYGGLGAEVVAMRKSRVRWKPIRTRAGGTSSTMIVQQFIYTGRRPVSYRVNTLFGKVLYSMRCEASAAHPELAGPQDFRSPSRHEGVSIVATALGARVEPTYEEAIIRLAESAHAAFPEVPLLGFDIVREVSSGKLYVLEANAIGYVWNFTSRQLADYGFSFEKQFDGVRKAAYILAEKTQQFAS